MAVLQNLAADGAADVAGVAVLGFGRLDGIFKLAGGVRKLIHAVLRCEHLAADAAVRALGEAKFGAGGRHGGIDNDLIRRMQADLLLPDGIQGDPEILRDVAPGDALLGLGILGPAAENVTLALRRGKLDRQGFNLLAPLGIERQIRILGILRAGRVGHAAAVGLRIPVLEDGMQIPLRRNRIRAHAAAVGVKAHRKSTDALALRGRHDIGEDERLALQLGLRLGHICPAVGVIGDGIGHDRIVGAVNVGTEQRRVAGADPDSIPLRSRAVKVDIGQAAAAGERVLLDGLDLVAHGERFQGRAVIKELPGKDGYTFADDCGGQIRALGKLTLLDVQERIVQG